TTNSNHHYPICENLLKRDFFADIPNSKWVGDITYIRTDEGWLYLATVKDLCTKKIVGYAFSERIDANLVVAALSMAYNRQKPDGDLIFHSDRGVQYASNKYREALAAFGITQSMSRKGDPYDNTVAENFFSCLKNELVHHKHYKTRAEAQADIFAYIETYYNAICPHSGICVTLNLNGHSIKAPESFDSVLFKYDPKTNNPCYLTINGDDNRQSTIDNATFGLSSINSYLNLTINNVTLNQRGDKNIFFGVGDGDVLLNHCTVNYEAQAIHSADSGQESTFSWKFNYDFADSTLNHC
ncbi:MAG: IS3 family transposase, partial [Ruminococcus sp.]|nr:IS3 family transposase [Ruminococcus sp.]